MADEGLLRVGVLASGRGTNLRALLDAQAGGTLGARIALVLSDQAAARVLERARQASVPALVCSRRSYPDRKAHDQAIMAHLEEHRVELVVLAGYMRILSRAFVSRYKGKMINIHPSLLPAFPGLDAHRQALEHGVKVSGCTVHFVDEGVDSGPIIFQAAVPVYPDDTVETLSQRILVEEHRLLPEAVRLFAAGRLEVTGRRVRILSERGRLAWREHS